MLLPAPGSHKHLPCQTALLQRVQCHLSLAPKPSISDTQASHSTMHKMRNDSCEALGLDAVTILWCQTTDAIPVSMYALISDVGNLSNSTAVLDVKQRSIAEPSSPAVHRMQWLTCLVLALVWSTVTNLCTYDATDQRTVSSCKLFTCACWNNQCDACVHSVPPTAEAAEHGFCMCSIPGLLQN